MGDSAGVGCTTRPWYTATLAVPLSDDTTGWTKRTAREFFLSNALSGVVWAQLRNP